MTAVSSSGAAPCTVATGCSRHRCCRPASSALPPTACWGVASTRARHTSIAAGKSDAILAHGSHLYRPHSVACRAAADPAATSSGEFSSFEVQTTVQGRAAAVRSAAVDIAIEQGPNNSRCIWAGVGIEAPAQAVFAALTSYEALGTFIPGLAENRCLQRYPDGCLLQQVGQQDVALGLRFKARVRLRIREHPSGIPVALLTRGPGTRDGQPGSSGYESGSSSDSVRGWKGPELPWWPFGSSQASSSSGSGSDDDLGRRGFSETRFLRPRSPLGAAPHMDISFELVEGDFAAFRGMWRIQAAGPTSCRLSYTLFVRPQPWLLVGLIERRIQGEIGANLAAVKAHVEAQMAAGAGPAPPTLPPTVLR